MTDYDIDKVSPRPWKVKVNEKVLADGHTFREFWIEDANGGIVTIYPKHSNPRQEEFYAHIVHCVNEASTGNHVEDCDFPFKLDEAGNINTGWGDLVLEVCPHNDWIVELLINSTNHLPVVLAQYAALQSRIAEWEGALGDMLRGVIEAYKIQSDPYSGTIGMRCPFCGAGVIGGTRENPTCYDLHCPAVKARAKLSACVQPVIDKDVCGKETANNETQLEAPAEETK